MDAEVPTTDEEMADASGDDVTLPGSTLPGPSIPGAVDSVVEQAEFLDTAVERFVDTEAAGDYRGEGV